MPHLPVLFGYHASNLGNSHVPLSLCRYWNESGRPATLTVTSADETISYPWLEPALKGIRKSVVYKLGNPAQPRQITESLFLRKEADASPVYLWAGLSLEIFEKFHERGTKIILERINCHRATSRKIILQACAHWNEQLPETFTDNQIEEENRKLALSDSIFCPSPMVRKSMIDNGVPEEKLLSSSYGWAPERFPASDEARKEPDIPVFLFTGTLCVRKGILLLLEAWKKAGIAGKLLLCGGIYSDIEAAMQRHRNTPNIEHIAYTKDIGQVYRMADVFVFPSLEEGGPMVTYEAMAHGIPPLVTAMGAGAIVRDGIDGIVLPDFDVDAWASAMADIAEKHQKRVQLGLSAQERAWQFTWKNVAEQRAGLLENRYPELWHRS
jgi:glycosyltransferase involved in cell wall biosynthesis